MTLSEYERKLIENVSRHGWQATLVGEGDDAEPGFAYTIGLWESLCTPELIIFGLNSDLMHSMLWEMFRQLKSGAALTDGRRWSNLLEGFDCISRPVHPSQISNENLNSALWYRRHRSGDSALLAYQIFWPGAVDGLFPWEAGCHEDVRTLQPLLYLPAEKGIA